MRNRYNETTLEILGVLARAPATCPGIAKALRMHPTTVGSTLLRLFRHGNVAREKIREGKIVVDRDEKITRPRYVHVYRLTKKGHDRLQRGS